LSALACSDDKVKAYNGLLSTLLRSGTCELRADGCGLTCYELLLCSRRLAGGFGAETEAVSTLQQAAVEDEGDAESGERGPMDVAEDNVPVQLTPTPAPASDPVPVRAVEAHTLSLRHNSFLTYVDDPVEAAVLHACDVTRDVTSSAGSGDAPNYWGDVCRVLFEKCAHLEYIDVSYCATSAKQANELCTGLVAGLQWRRYNELAPLRRITARGLQQLCPTSAAHLQQQVTTLSNGSTELALSGFNMCI
jgi:hypothetical protein